MPPSIQAGIFKHSSRKYLEKLPSLAVHRKQRTRGSGVGVQRAVSTSPFPSWEPPSCVCLRLCLLWEPG